MRSPRTRSLLGGSAGAVVGLYPGIVPRPAFFEGAIVGICAAAGVGMAALIAVLSAVRRRNRYASRTRPSRLVLTGCGGAVSSAFAWSAQWRILSTGAPGFGISDIRYWTITCVAAVTLASVLTVLGAALRRAVGVKFRRSARTPAAAQIAHPAVRAVCLATVVAITVPAGAASAAPADAGAAAAAHGTLLPSRSGGATSTIDRDELGPYGRRFVSDTAYPRGVRVYAGLAAADDAGARAASAADDLVHTGGLDASAVVVMIPTGSGWIDATAARTFEKRLDGDVAEVAMQYAAVPSWAAYVFDLGGAVAAARLLITAVADRIGRLPAAERPDLYIFGESLGAAAGSRALASSPAAKRMLCSALWVGPPGGFTDPVPHRSTVVTNATDPVPHWSPGLAVHPVRPAGQTGTAPSSGPAWIPVVSFLQTSADLLVSRSGPEGTGHVYGAEQLAGLRTC